MCFLLYHCLQEAAIEAKFTEVNAVNKQRLQNLEFAESLLNQVKYFHIKYVSYNNINLRYNKNNNDFFPPCIAT